MRPERDERWKETETVEKNYLLQVFFEFIEATSGPNHSRQDDILRHVLQLTDAYSESSCSLSHRVFRPIARTDHCPKLDKQAVTYENAHHGSRAWSFWRWIALWRAEEQRSRMTCAAEGDDRIVADDVSAQVDTCTSDETYSMKWCKDVEERRALMQRTFFPWNTTCLSTAARSGSSSLIRSRDE